MREIRQDHFSSPSLRRAGDLLISYSTQPPEPKFRHPWRTVPVWNTAENRWEAKVRAGYVNGLDPTCFGYLNSDLSQETREVDLDDEPFIPLNSFRSVPSEGDPLPGFFKQLGVRKPKNNTSTDGLGGLVGDATPEDPSLPPPRTLVAMDFYVAVARASYQAQILPVDGSGASGLVVDYAVTYDTSQLDQAGSRARLMQAAKFQPVRKPTLMDRLFGNFQDEGEDRVLISTIFLLSQQNATELQPDGTWTPYVKHRVFWNLCYASKNVPPAPKPPPIRIFTGLAAGFGDIIANQILSSTNELSDKISNALNTTNNEGKFWTT